MKKLVFLAVLLSAVMIPQAQAGSSTYGCDSCHAPHHTPTENIGMPLWTPERDVDMSGMIPYSSVTNTLDATVGIPDGISKMCLSCHDGTGSHSAPGTGGNFTSDISNSHPVSFVYDTALATADGELLDPATAPSNTVDGGTIETDLLDPFGKLQCSSCHDPHKQAVVEEGHLRIANDGGYNGGQLCKTCHDK